MCLVLTCTTRTNAGLQSEDAELTTPMGPPLAHLARYGGEVSPQGVGSGLRRVTLYGGGGDGQCRSARDTISFCILVKI